MGPVVEQFPYLPADGIIADRVEVGGCNLCFNSCTAKYHLKDGRLIGITANDNDELTGRVCAKAQTQVQMYYSPYRLTYPQKRVGKRGEGKFERISWGQALDELAEKLKQV
ncbi:MAG: molybdopterin-dependent oxidoreductase, partial [Chloroflexi bacterium]|nr:molybdopterin-dependent oxidoreductase [Chloroflexota bacterium]